MITTSRHAVKRVSLATYAGLLLSVTACMALSAQRTKPATATAAGTRRHGTATAQARLRFVPELLTTVAGNAGSESFAPTLYYNGIAGTAAAMPASINSIAFNSKGDLYLIASYPASLFKINGSDGTISTVLGAYYPCDGENCGPTSTVQVDLSNPLGVAVSPLTTALGAMDDVFVTDTGNNQIYRLDAQNVATVVPGTAGLLNSPAGLAFDASGNLYIADSYNSAIRKISAADGKITTIAGGVGYGFAADGTPATQAQLKRPFAIAFDPSGNLYFTDTDNYVVQKINLQSGDPQYGLITRVAGDLVGGYSGDGGPATDAELSNAEGLAFDAAGQLYIGDTSSDVVRRIALDGTISTIAGIDPYPNTPGFYIDGLPSTQAYINNVAGLAFDANGTLYMSALGIARVLKLGPGGALNFGQQNIGTSATRTMTVVNEGSAAATFFNPPFVVQGTGFTALPAGTQGCVQNSILQPGASCQISVTFSPTSATDYVTTLGLNEDDGAPPSADLRGTGVLPATTTTITVSPQSASTGDLVTLSAMVVPASGTGATPTGTVQFVDDNTGNVLAQGTLTGSGAVSVQLANLPAGDFYVVGHYAGDTAYSPSESDGQDLEIDAKAATISLTASATTITVGGAVTLNAQVSSAAGTPTGNVLFELDGVTAATVALQGGAASATITIPAPGMHAVQAVYAGDGIFAQVASAALSVLTHGAILQFTPGSGVTLAGTPSDDLHGGFGGDGGPATSGYLHTPYGVSTDAGGNVYIADEENNVVRKVAVDGTISTVAGIPYAASIGNTRFGGDGGQAIYAYLDHPTSVIADAAGNLFIADYSNNVVRKVTAATGIIQTIVGNYYAGGGYNGDGAGTFARVSHPSELALDATGNLYIADTGNNLVRKLDASGNLSTVAGNYYLAHNGPVASGVPATSVDLYSPIGVVLDLSGNLYISDTNHNVIRKVDTSGTITTVGGGGPYAAAPENVPALSVSLNQPQQIAIDLAGTLYFAEAGNSIVRKIDTAGILTTPIGYIGSASNPWSHFDPQGEPSTLFQMQSPSAVAVAPDGSLLVTDNYNQTVIRSGVSGALLFGPESIGATSDVQTLTLANAGDAPLVFGSTPYTVTGDFTVSSPSSGACNFTTALAPGAHCNIGVAHANQGGSGSGSVRFSANVQGTPTVLLKSNTTFIPSATALYLPGSTATAGASLLFIAVVAVQGPAAAGSISFYDGSALIGTAPITNGYALISYSALSVGTHTITATYLGGGLYGTSTSDPQTIVITGPATATTLSLSSANLGVGSPLTMTATVTTGSGGVVAEGSTTFYDGSTVLGTRAVNASGVASLTISSLSAGTHAITAAYQLNADYAGSTSAQQNVTVSSGGGGNILGLDYVLSLNGQTPLVLRRGQTKQVLVSASQLGANYHGRVTLACGTLPADVTCSFSPATLNIGGAVENLNSTLTITAAP